MKYILIKFEYKYNLFMSLVSERCAGITESANSLMEVGSTLL